MALYTIGAIICAIIIALMALDIRNDLRLLAEIKALPKGAKLSEEQRELLERNSTFKI